MDLQQKLEILADAAKYDASCASSGTEQRDSSDGKGLGSTAPGMGICHSYAPDGRCISLLKVLLTNACNYDCLYCVNRATSNVPRARFTIDEVVKLTLDFYRRNYIEGLFLSSGIIRNADYTMEQVVGVARKLREQHFRGYIHLKTIPEADDALIAEAGRYADRLSINIEVPEETSLARLAPEKDVRAIRRTMGRLRLKLDEAKEANNKTKASKAKPQRFAPAGQSTQMIVGADSSNDQTILATSANLYGSYRLKRVYYSAFSPIPDSSRALPLAAPPLMREHRLYQADWLMRFYGFDVGEITEGGGMLPLDIDPKLAWALRHRDRFPLDINIASREELLRVPGFGSKAVDRIIATRRVTSIRVSDLGRLHIPKQKALPFIVLADHRPSPRLLDAAQLVQRFKPKAAQLGFGF